MTEEDTGDATLGPLIALPGVPTRPVSGAAIATSWGQAVHDSQFGSGAVIDIREGWYKSGIVAGAVDVDIPMGNGQASPLIGMPGEIFGIWYRIGGTITAGTLSLKGKAGSVNSDPATIPVGGSGLNTFYFPVPIVIPSVGTAIRVVYSTTADFAPLTISINAGLLVRYDYRPG